MRKSLVLSRGEQCVMQLGSNRGPDLIYGAPDAVQKRGISISRSPFPHLSRQATRLSVSICPGQGIHT